MGFEDDLKDDVGLMNKSLDEGINTDPPNTEPPGTDAPGTEAPGTELPGTESPGTEAPSTETPTTEVPKEEDDELKTLREETESLRAKLNEALAPKLKTPTTETPTTEVPLTLDEQDFLGDLDLDEVSRDPKEFNKLLNKIYTQTVTDTRKVLGEGVLRTIPDVARNIFDSMIALKEMSDEFYKDNKDLKPFKKVVSTVFEEFASDNPDKKYDEVLKDVGDEVRKRLELHKKATTKNKDKNSPPRLPGKKKAPGRSQEKPDLSSIENQIGDMNETLGR